MARRCGWLRDLRELLVERQSDLGKNQEEMAVTHTEKQLKNAHAFDLTDTISAAKSNGSDEALPLERVKYKATTEWELAEFSRQFSVDHGEVWPLAATTDSEFAESAGVFSVDDGEARPPGGTTEAELAESWGTFTVEIGEARPPKKAKYTVEQIVDVLGPQFHEHFAETSCKATSSGGCVRKSARLSPNGPEVFEFESGSGSSLHPLPRRRRRLQRTSGVGVKGRKSARLVVDLLPDVEDLRPRTTSKLPSFTRQYGRRQLTMRRCRGRDFRDC